MGVTGGGRRPALSALRRAAASGSCVELLLHEGGVIPSVHQVVRVQHRRRSPCLNVVADRCKRIPPTRDRAIPRRHCEPRHAEGLHCFGRASGFRSFRSIGEAPIWEQRHCELPALRVCHDLLSVPSGRRTVASARFALAAASSREPDMWIA